MHVYVLINYMTSNINRFQWSSACITFKQVHLPIHSKVASSSYIEKRESKLVSCVSVRRLSTTLHSLKTELGNKLNNFEPKPGFLQLNQSIDRLA